MKLANTLIKLAAAIAAVAGIAFLVVRYFDDIKAWISKFFPCCDYTLEDDFEIEVPVNQSAPKADAPTEEPAPAEEAAPAAEEAPAEEAAPTAEENDFEA